jgi:XTP/dITP diphosphohydrolase
MALRLVLATANLDKVREIERIFGEVGSIELIDRPADVADVEETGATLLENARLKAQALVTATGVAAVADDTGLSIDALDGAPGVRSARFAGEHATYSENVGKVLAELDHVANADRAARFSTVALVLMPDGSEWSCEGVIEGVIARAPQGSEGFGYDPIFLPQGGDGRTFAEMALEEKNALSHRGRAFRSLARLLAEGGLLAE